MNQAIAKVKEATDPNSSLFKQEFADDLALTGMARYVRTNTCTHVVQFRELLISDDFYCRRSSASVSY